MHAADKFIAYDDVAFIKQGWINRNRILLNNQPHLFTVPLTNASSNSLISQTKLDNRSDWRSKLLKTMKQAYLRAPQYKLVMPVMEEVLLDATDSISELAVNSIEAVVNYIGLKVEIKRSSEEYANSQLRAEARVVDICRQENAGRYVNAIGGRELYSKENFASSGIELRFIQSRIESYPQFTEPFTPYLSIIDALMFNTPEEVAALTAQYELV